MADIDKARRTALGMTINNADVTSEIQNRLISMTFTDAADGQDDDIEIVLADRDNIVIGSWLMSEIGKRAAENLKKNNGSKAIIVPTITQQNWNGNGKNISLCCGNFVLDKVTMDGPPQTVTMIGTGLGYGDSSRSAKRTKAWEKTTLQKIALAIGKNCGYSVMYLSDKTISYSRVEQNNVTDAAFLQRLCTAAGMSLKTTSSTLVIFEQSIYENKTATRTITKGDGSYESYAFNAELSDTYYDECTVTYEDPITGTTYTGTYNLGTKTGTGSTSSSSSTKKYTGQTVNALFTAYYPANNSMEGGLYDAQGNKLNPSKNTCAAPKSIAFGKQIQISGTGTSRDGKVYTVTDRGGAIKVVNGVYHFDLLMATKAECNSWGRRSGKALIISGTSSTNSGTTSASSGTSTTKSGTTSSSSKDIVDVAIAEIGYKESGNNRTKYGEYTGTNGLAWCHAFVAWCANQAGVPTSVIPKTASVASGMQWFKDKGRFKAKGTYTPGRGDIMYQKSSGASHAGIVEYVSGNTVHTVEGNASNMVKRNSYALTNVKITGYGVPNYSNLNSSSSSSSSSSGSDTATLTITNEKVSSNAEAKQLAMARLREANKGKITITFNMPGDITLCAGLTVAVRGFGALSGNYYIEKTTHTISKSTGYKTTINLRQVITGY
ncbi:MAG: CHAP domain-containing protein [Clostridia bacterium]|nr:CHAP domain-containing protein [Clostridia bacterium]